MERLSATRKKVSTIKGRPAMAWGLRYGITARSERACPADELLRREPEGAVETDDLAVEVVVLGDGLDEGRVLAGTAHSLGVRDLRAPVGLEFLACLAVRRGEDRAGGDGDDADSGGGQVTSRDERHGDDAALGRGVGQLADLARVGGDRRGVDDDAAPAVLGGLLPGNRGRREPHHVEEADQVGLDGGAEAVHAHRAAVLAEKPAAGGRLLGKDGSPMSMDGFRTTIESYLISFFNVMRLAAAAIARQEPAEDGGRGVIINTASIAAYEGQIGQLPYAAAKGGIVSMTLVAARDLSPAGIRVVTIAPGTILTPGVRPGRRETRGLLGPADPLPKRMGRPGEYAALVQAIAENDYLNGEVIRLDGALRFPPK